MSYQLTTQLPSAQDLIDLANATSVDATAYMELVEKRLEAELRVIELNSDEADSRQEATETAALRDFYGMNHSAPTTFVEKYHWQHGSDDDNFAQLFPKFSTRRSELEAQQAAKQANDLRRRSKNAPTYIPEEIFEQTVTAAKRAGIPVGNITMEFIVAEGGGRKPPFDIESLLANFLSK